MTMADRNSAREMMTALGGLCCKPSAVRSRDRTTTMRMNEVVMMTIDGASDSTVIRPTIWMTRADRLPPLPRSTLTVCAITSCGRIMIAKPTMNVASTMRFIASGEIFLRSGTATAPPGRPGLSRPWSRLLGLAEGATASVLEQVVIGIFGLYSGGRLR